MSTTEWTLVPKRGIRSSAVEILLGTERAVIRASLAGLFGAPSSNYPNEDDFEGTDGIFVRTRFDENELLKDIEFLEGRPT